MKAYNKVVFTQDDRLLSCQISLPAAEVTYALNQKTVPFAGNGPLGAFDNLEAALDFSKIYRPANYYEVYEAEVELSQLNRFWYCKEKSRIKYLAEIPEGTVFCDSITLIRKVK